MKRPLQESLFLVALSGGADSVALLRALIALGYHVEAAHCNFHLRGKESDRDEMFCNNLCEELGIRLHVAHFDTIAFATLRKVSIEMAARELRYRWFTQLAKDTGAAGVCIAHHSDDQVETILLNLLRGTGIKGLLGMQRRNGIFCGHCSACQGRRFSNIFMLSGKTTLLTVPILMMTCSVTSCDSMSSRCWKNYACRQAKYSAYG